MIYEIKFQKKGNSSIDSWIIKDKKILDNALLQLKKLATSFNGIIINGINDLEYLYIESRNYSYKEKGEYYVARKTFDNDIEFISIGELINITGKEYVHFEKDVTNELLFEFGICGDDFRKKGKVLFENNSIFADAFEFKLEEGYKIIELFDLLFIAKVFYKRLTFTYDELKLIYKNGNNNYKELKLFDIRDGGIRDIVGQKMRLIKNKTKMKDNILDIISVKISIRQEKALK